MKKIAFLIFMFYCNSITFGQKTISNYESIRISAFIGESSGLSIDKPIYNSMLFQFNIGINELLFDYNYIDKYSSSRINQSYNNIYSSSIGIVYHKNIKEKSPFSYRVSFGGQFRIIPRYTYQLSDNNLPPNVIIIDDPIIKTKIDFGINYFIGISYKLNDHINIFTDIGGYSEITDKFSWTNPQFKIGIGYLFIRKEE